mmetsp:Transcript_10850/g.18238  ORF Transcript_10850/g.18238 Transcript_10850/m.18238 type:complete len:319 (+) Transcript_10850:93-1049(+)|eukprot:CAMPEP_0174955150 /NCGR_PEP_ID=MMETSP0004_2-20121128/824_1 /TAXON_ID=420556 /ORGANISM="Ochromonas sp., Strain CCMP1393" /LENGTH=318 /DNA_ID=CAMNT_0016203051 /DNA_START=58 /DNA_END=1014 /DNA_ORIENTATION=-
MSCNKRLLFLTLLVLCSSMTMGVISFWNGDVGANIALMKDGMHNPYREFNQFVNNILFPIMGLSSVSDKAVEYFGDENGYYAQCYLRDLVAGTLVYWVTAGVWHIVIYKILGHRLFTSQGRPFPTTETIVDQMCLAQASIFIYAALPILSEYIIENNYTQAYFYMDQVGGWSYYFLYLFIYIVFVEIGIYWMHRTLHTNKFLYKYIHGLHHKYNKATTLTPWASIAFNPVDGILQASPYVVGLFLMPVHYYTHIFLLFFSGMWATNIHDAVWGDSEPIMGSKYHTVHHTHYHYNFGQWFIFCDYIFGTLKVPEKDKFA